MPFFITKAKFNAAIKKALQPIITGLSSYAVNIGGTVYPNWESRGNVESLINSYDVFAVIDRIASAVAAVDLEVYRKTPDPKKQKYFKAYQQRQHSDLFKQVYKIKALTELEEGDPLYDLLENPSGYQSEAEFMRLLTMLLLASGEVYLWKERTLTGKIIKLHIFTGPDTSINVTGAFPYTIASYNFYISGVQVLKFVPPADVIPIKFASPIYDQNGSHLRGFSPLKPGQGLVNRIATADARTDSTLKNGTIPGIIYLKNTDSGPEYDQWRQKYQQFINNDDNAGAAFPMEGDIGYIQTGLKMVDMQLMEGQKMSFKKLCNLYKVSDTLFNSDAAATESNVKEKRKDFYTAACIPVADVIKDAFNKYLCPDFDPRDYVDFDFSEIPELQADLLSTFNAISAMPISLTGNEMRALMKYEASDADNMDIPLMKQGYSPVNQLDPLPAPSAGLP